MQKQLIAFLMIIALLLVACGADTNTTDTTTTTDTSSAETTADDTAADDTTTDDTAADDTTAEDTAADDTTTDDTAADDTTIDDTAADDTTAEATENANPYSYDLDVVIDFPMAFGGTAQIGVNSEWRLRDESENESVGRVVLFMDDGFFTEVYVSNDPENDSDSPRALLDGRNNTAEILEVPYEDLTIYVSETFLGNALGVSALIDEQRLVFIEIRNGRGIDETELLDTVFAMIASVEVITEE